MHAERKASPWFCVRKALLSALIPALTPAHATTTGLACRHYGHRPTFSSQMASMTLLQPVGQQSTSLTPSQLQYMVGGYPTLFSGACCLWHPCLMPDADYIWQLNCN